MTPKPHKKSHLDDLHSKDSLKDTINIDNIQYQLLHGDVYAGLNDLQNNSIDCVVTSPPYWSQRDYSFEHQIGNEATVEEYFLKLTTIYHLLRQKLTPYGIFYHNIGDKYLNKYGNTALGMLPYKLAVYMVRDGWFLEDIIIWYKPNHMPSSVKNRFTNTYEPVFVFAKSGDNYYHRFRNKSGMSNILKIPLQQTSYAHVATYPEKLVESLIEMGIPTTGTILDPFGGSGTTCKAVQNLNLGQKYALNCIMIEAQNEYVKIIFERCGLDRNSLKEIPFFDYSLLPLSLKLESINSQQCSDLNANFLNDTLLILICRTEAEYQKNIPLLYDESFFDSFPDDGVLFFGLPDHDLTKIMAICKAQHWIIRNMLIIPIVSDWIPIFMCVKDIKSVEYHFNIDAIRVNHQIENQENWEDVDFIGYKVQQSQLLYSFPQQGIIKQIISKKPNGLPEWVVVAWDSGENRLEEVINFSFSERKVEFFCPHCGVLLKIYHQNQKEVLCPKCHLLLWQDLSSIPKIVLNPRKVPQFNIREFRLDMVVKNTKKNYDGKFKNSERINMGQSPGARVSVSEQYFSVQRYYHPSQGLVSDYLNLHRKAKNLSKSALTALFPEEYRHTVGHWLRKDMGGSIPKQEDMLKLQQILDLDDIFVDYTNRMGIKLQTVFANEKGKNPGDFLEYPLDQIVKMLEKGSE